MKTARLPLILLALGSLAGCRSAQIERPARLPSEPAANARSLPLPPPMAYATEDLADAPTVAVHRQL